MAPAYHMRLWLIVEEHFMIEQDIRRNAQETALSMIKLHGLRAQAVAQERAAELRQQGDTAGYDLWQQVYAAICELRRTAPAMARAQT
jgi:hypothetical protein